jgi:hypothetical protein
MKLRRLSAALPEDWEKAAPFLQSALSKGQGESDWWLEDVYNAAMTDRIMLWGLMDEGRMVGACATCVLDYPRRRVLEILMLGTEPHTDWAPCLEEMKQVARKFGATALQGTGRPGWARKLGGIERRVFEVKL